MRPARPTRGVLAAFALVTVVTVAAAGCGGGSASGPTTTSARPAPAWQTLTQGDIHFQVPASWPVARGVCRCPLDRSSATIDNGGEEASGGCNCPAFEAVGPGDTRPLDLYAGTVGALPGGRLVRTRGGLTAQVVVDTTLATTTAIFPASGNWIIVGPLRPGSSRERAAQLALERKIVDSAGPA